MENGKRCQKALPRTWIAKHLPSSRWGWKVPGQLTRLSLWCVFEMGSQQAFGKLQLLGHFSSVKTHISYRRFCDLLQAKEKPQPPTTSSSAPCLYFPACRERCRSEVFCLPTREKVLKKKSVTCQFENMYVLTFCQENFM